MKLFCFQLMGNNSRFVNGIKGLVVKCISIIKCFSGIRSNPAYTSTIWEVVPQSAYILVLLLAKIGIHTPT